MKFEVESDSPFMYKVLLYLVWGVIASFLIMTIVLFMVAAIKLGINVND